MLKKTIDTLITIIFPINCFGCKKADYLLCNRCQKKLFSNTERIEKQPTKNLDYIIICVDYHDNLVNKCIKGLKYNGLQRLAKPLGELMAQALTRSNVSDTAGLMPIPLHPRKQRRRGYNQSQLLAKAAVSKIKLKLETSLKRLIYTPQQANLDRADRLKNISGAFSVFGESTWNHVILLDDVATTYSTLDTAAVELKKHGVKKVGAVVIAKNV